MNSRNREELENRLASLEKERRAILSELQVLREREEKQGLAPSLPRGRSTLNFIPSNPDQKIELFLKLFCCRDDVYPKLWENLRQGKKGYAPACNNEWVHGVCMKPRVKCSECANQAFRRLDTDAVQKHLKGQQTIGTYAIRQDDKCIFLAADFDGDSWALDISAYKAAAVYFGIEVAVERSRSGRGGHAWIFFSEAVPAALARQLGTLILSRASTERESLSLSSYDRFFPSQDLVPQGGFGNLIALPLQKEPRENGNSVFVNDQFAPFANQWEFLARVRRLSDREAREVVHQYVIKQTGFSTLTENSPEILDNLLLETGEKGASANHAGKIELVMGSQLSISIAGLPPPRLVVAFKRTATFANPKFYELQRLRFPTFKTPRFIFCGELRDGVLRLPRGVLERCLEIADIAGAETEVKDLRPSPKKIRARFRGELTAQQKKALDSICEYETGVLVAPPGTGKTVIGCAVIAKRKISTLILVHREPLLEQWQSQLVAFLGKDKKQIGVISGKKKKQSGEIDIAMLQTLARCDDLESILSGYSQIIVDECHHVAAVSFEEVLKQSTARYFLGLTATPYRKDGHQKILHMQCGPVRHEMVSTQIDREVRKRVIVRETEFRLPEGLGDRPPIHIIWESLISDVGRLKMVVSDVIELMNKGRFPLVLSDRKEHLKMIEEMLSKAPTVQTFRLEGGMGKKARSKIMLEMAANLEEKKPMCLLATGSLIGEGFDLPELDSLVLAMPISFKGRVVQYVGRLHRLCSGKEEVLVYDYLDSWSSLTISMYRKRLVAYRNLGYVIEEPKENFLRRYLHRSEKV